MNLAPLFAIFFGLYINIVRFKTYLALKLLLSVDENQVLNTNFEYWPFDQILPEVVKARILANDID